MNKQKLALSFLLSLNASISSNLHCAAAEGGDIVRLLQNPSTSCLQGQKIVLKVEKAPNFDVPSTGAGDCLFYPRMLREKLTSLGAEDVVLDLGKRYAWLASFFGKCSDIGVFGKMDETAQKEYTPLEVRTALDSIPDLATFESKSRYLPACCEWANGEVAKIATTLEELQTRAVEEAGRRMHPVLFTRQSAAYEIKSDEEERLFGYLNHRSISREELAAMLTDKPDHTRVFNIQFEDQKEDDIAGTEKPTTIFEGYSERNGAFVNDAILMAAVIKAGGDVVSIDSSPLNLAIGIPSVDDTRKSIKALLGKDHNSRWKKPFLKEDGSICWSPNVDLLVQEKADDWSTVGQTLVKLWDAQR